MDKEIALKILRELHDKALFSERTALETFIPEFKESEDEKIRKAILAFVRQSSEVLDKQNQNNMIAWLEKQGDTSEIVNKKKIASDILRGAAINLITWIDYNAAEGNMCLSNMECKDIEDALVSGDWDKIYAYIKKKLEKQGEQNVPLREMVLNVWELGNIWKEITKGVCNTEHGTQLEFIIKHWNEGEHYTEWLEKQGEQKPVENKGMDLVEEEMTPFQKKVFCIVDTAIEEEQGLSNICNELLALAIQEIEQKPAWSEEDEDNMMLIEDRFSDYLQYTREDSSLTRQQKFSLKEDVIGYVKWLNSLKKRIGG